MKKYQNSLSLTYFIANKLEITFENKDDRYIKIYKIYKLKYCGW